MKSFLAGALAGSSGVLVGHPLDTLRVRAQTRHFGDLGARAVLTSTLRAEGVRGLYRGILPPLCTTAGASAVAFASLEFAKKSLQSRDLVSDPTLVTACSAAFSGCMTSLFTTPVVRAKILLQTQSASQGSVWTELKKLVPVLNGAGLSRGWYSGYWTQLPVETLGRIAYFTTWDLAKRWSTRSDGTLTKFDQMLCGASAGIAGWTAIYPLDVCRSRRMAHPPGGTVAPSFLATVRHIYATDGVPGFARGYVVCTIRAGAVAMIALPVYDFFMTNL